MPEVVDPGWILKAVLSVIVLGLFCAYLTLCLYFYLGQWQFVLHPSRAVPQTPASLSLPFQDVRFGPGKSGEPELTGWYVPSDSSADPTVLLLHNEAGSMSAALPAVATLHAAHLNVLVFDYRGYGRSDGRHPTERTMRQDTTSAYRYLIDTRHVRPTELLVDGLGLGASLATALCTQHPEIAGLVLQGADGDTATRVEADQRSRFVPVSWLFHERFPLADPLSRLHTPKLIVSYTRGGAPVVAQRAADPKTTVELPDGTPPGGEVPAIRRFVDTYLVHPVPLLQ